jgi:GMP synthase (glutamine-hydrolysing)
MRIHCVIHAEFENPGIIETWAKEQGHIILETHTYKGEILPTADKFDLLIIMGGPQSPLNIDKWPYLQDEMILITQAIKENKAILGICLGAQLIAECLGAKTEQSPYKEVGLFPIELLPAADQDPVFSKFPKNFSVMHWHNDMPGLPKNTELLAKSNGCPRQAFKVGDRIYGLQCHLEMTKNNILDMLEHCESDLKPDLYVDSKQQLLSHDLEPVNQKMIALLDYLGKVVS